MAVLWTPQQRQAIDCPMGKGAVLVSAAAGSGKTAVLVARILKNMVEKKININEFLVVTFTKAAAAGMRQKLRRAIRDLADSAAENGDLETAAFADRQLDLISSADINTIDSFCNKVVRNNFHCLGIDPNLRNTDSDADDILSEKVMSDLFERLYEENDECFAALVEAFSSYRNDYSLMNIVKQMYSFTENFAKPDEWLREKCADYPDDIAESPWFKAYLSDSIRAVGKKFKKAAKRLLREISPDDDGVICCTQTLENILNSASKMSEAVSPFGFGEEEIFSENFPKRKGSKWSDPQKDLYERTRTLARSFTEESALVSYADAEEPARVWHWTQTAQNVRNLCALTEKFRAELMKEKAARNAWSFSDIEHMTYNLLSTNEEIQRAYRKKYKEILIDEYQDTNDLQDSIFASISKNGANIFMVGDLKQSIYGFRGGDPYIFKERSRVYPVYEPGKDGDKKIILSQNFRSRPEVLDSVNVLFENIMSDEIGDVVYDDTQSLQYSSALPKSGNDADEADYKSEFHYIINETGELNSYCEAKHAAQIVREIVGKKYFDAESKTYKKIGYGDITILSRSTSTVASEYARAFEECRIPLFIEQPQYFEKREINTVLSLLSVLANYRQDVPLVGVMRSPMFGFSYDELAQIRIDYGYTEGEEGRVRRRYFLDCVKECAISQTELGEKCAHMLRLLDKWRDFTRKHSVSELIQTVIEETAFYDFMGALEGGGDAQANLRLLCERAKKFEETNSGGLYAFINYIKRLQRGDVDTYEASSAGAGCVSMTTSHKSKGLEYPVVILTGTGKKLTSPRRVDEVLLHKDLGIGLMYPSTESDCMEETFQYDYIRSAKKTEGVSEIMRLLYVSLTRAKYKLYVTASGSANDIQKLEDTRELDSEDIKNAPSISAWMVPIVMKSDLWMYKTMSMSDEEEQREEAAEEISEKHAEDEAQKEKIRAVLDRRYRYYDISMIPSRTTATELKRLSAEEDSDSLLLRGDGKSGGMRRRKFNLTEMPDFIENAPRPTQVGTTYHQILANIPLDKPEKTGTIEYVREHIEKICDAGGTDTRIAQRIKEKMASDIAGFFRSELGQKLLASEKVYRERSFQTYIGAGIYNSGLDELCAEENIILQGIIDCMFTDEEGRLILLDYKTDSCTKRNYREIVQKYKLQLDLYAYAVRKVTGVEVYKKYLYLFSPAMSVEVGDDDR